MEVDTVLRKVKRQFGDEYGIIINDLDIYDWITEAQLKIIRETTANDLTVSRAANTFPVAITDRVHVKRVAINNRALTPTSLSEVDLSDLATSTEGYPLYWYVDDSSVKLWPNPKSTDTYNVLITYSKLPTPLTLVAPYLEFHNYPTSPEYAVVPVDADYNGADANFYVTFATPRPDVTHQYNVGMGNTTGTAATCRWWLQYRGAVAPGTVRIIYSNGTTIRTTADIAAFPGLAADTPVTLRCNYVAATGVWTFYSVNDAGVETLVGTDDQADAFNLNPASFPISFNALGDGSASDPLEWRLYNFSLHRQDRVTLFKFSGSPDLDRLPTIPVPTFVTSSGHEMSVTGDIQVYNVDNVFSIPEVWHEDIVTYCIARAHNKNKDFRAEEGALETFNSTLHTRRDEAQSVDAPVYKLADPFDYGWDYY